MCLIGAVLTIGTDQLWLQSWAQSGELRIPATATATVELPAGPTLVYYESDVNIAPHIRLYVRDADGTWVRPMIPADDNSFRMKIGGWSGRALWQVELDEPGTFDVWCVNGDYDMPEDIPPTDRLVLFKQPPTLAEASARRKVIQVAGTTVTVGLAMLLYGLHFAALRRRNEDDAETPSLAESLESLT